MLEALESSQKRVLELFTFVGCFFFSIFGVLNIVYDKLYLGLLEMLLVVIGIINLLIYRKTSNYFLTSRILLIFISVLILIVVITGGYKNQGILWIYVIPPLTFFLRDKISALKWNIFFVTSILIFQIASIFGIMKVAYSFETIFVALCAYIAVSFLTYFYSDIFMNLLEGLKEKAMVDSLTGLYNREFLFAYLQQETEKIKRKSDEGICLAFIDLDDFKKINDTYGHQKGDEILSQISKIIRENFRSSDVVGRFGGDEFILVVNTKNKKAIEEKLRFIKNQIEKFFEEYGLSISYGIVEMPKETIVLEEALRLADERMYQMKSRKDHLEKK